MQRMILVAESDDELRGLFRAYFRKLGFEVATAASGLDCLEQLRQNPPAVLLLDEDLTWGGADGLLAWLREDSRCDRTAVVMMATIGGLSNQGEPVVASLQKPFRLTSLLANVNSALTQSGCYTSRRLRLAKHDTGTRTQDAASRPNWDRQGAAR